MKETKKYKEFLKQEKNAFDELTKTFDKRQLLLFKEYLTARHLTEQEGLSLIFK